MEDILNQALKQAEEAELFQTSLDLNEVKFENNKLKYITTKEVSGVGLRVISQGRLGFSSTTNLSSKEALVTSALTSARFGQEARFSLPSEASVSQVKVFDPNVEGFPIENRVAIAEEAINSILKINQEMYCWAEVSSSVKKTRMLNSKGLDIEYKKSYFSFYIGGLLVRGNSLLQIYDGASSGQLISDITPFLANISRSLSWSKQEMQIDSGRMPVIFTPKAMAALLEVIELGVNGKMVQKGASPLTGRLDSHILGQQVTIYDDPTIDFGPNSTPIDDEGVSTRPIALIKEGMLKGYVFDLQTAGMMKTESSGHGFRSFDSLPSPQCSNLVLLSGQKGFDELISQTRNGLLVDLVLGGGQSNILAGEFSLNIGLGFKIENGQVVGRVKDAMIAGNLFECLGGQIELGSEPSFFWQAVKTPPVLFESLPVSGR